jgi:hypothetical protein
VSEVNPLRNTITATISQPGFLYIGPSEIIFANGFEAP